MWVSSRRKIGGGSPARLLGSRTIVGTTLTIYYFQFPIALLVDTGVKEINRSEEAREVKAMNDMTVSWTTDLSIKVN